MTDDEMEKIYSETPPADIPWNIESPPKTLVELINTGQVQPCKTIDMGCGAGNYAIYLASVGFDVTGVDISPSAVALAQANAKQKGVACRFVAADVLGGLEEITETFDFDFAYDWSLLHHVFPDKREQYVETVHRLLVAGGKYLSVCFSEKDAGFGDTGNERRTPLGTVLYFSSEDELRDLFAPYFDITTLATIQIEGKREPHLMNWVFLEKEADMTYIMVDVEADGPIPGDYSMVCFGAIVVEPTLDRTFYGRLKPISGRWIPEALQVSGFTREETLDFDDPKAVVQQFSDWVAKISGGRPMFISDNNGFDWQFINWYFHHFLGTNPFGHSSTNLGSLYKGVVRDMFTNFKHLRKTRHTHNPVDDARGNAEALLQIKEEYGLKISLE